MDTGERMSGAYQVFVAEDEPFVREGIRNCLTQSGRFALCGEAADGEMALPAILELKPDILITDIKMPFMDGLALSRAVRRAMPWVKILIVSGYNEFDFAKQAIRIGVAEYLLKPFSAKTLLGALDGIVRQIEEERRQSSRQDQAESRARQEKQVLRDAFVDSILTGACTAEQAMERAAYFELDLVAKRYLAAAMELSFEQAQPGAAACVRDEVEEALSTRTDVFWCLRGGDRLALVARGDTEQQLDDAIYEIIAMVQRRLRRQLAVATVCAIGSGAARLTEIARSYQDASAILRALPSLPPDTVLNYNDIENGAAGALCVPEDAPLGQQLRYATRQDVENILQGLRTRFTDRNRNSVLYGYYWIMDLLMAAARVVNELGGDAHAVFPELEDAGGMLRAASSEAALTEIGRGILEHFLDFRENTQDIRYGDVIVRAKEYIHTHYGESDLSLNTVAEHCGFSPNHFSSIFSQNTGETFIEFLTRVRMEQARRLLLTTGLRSGEVAEAVGYHDVNYFRFLFKKHTGMSPRELRAGQD